jgi:hypothetical protein
VKEPLQFDYIAVGHVTIDVLSDGTRRAGGTAFFSALQAARLGQRTLIVTQGVPREVEELLEPYRGELDLRVLPSARTTTLQTGGWGASRRQHLLAWAGPLEYEHTRRLDTATLHLAPVAQEISNASGWDRRGGFLGLTAQGMVRDWRGVDGRISAVPPSRGSEQLAGSCDAVVLSEHERVCCAELIQRARDGGAVVAITAESRPSTLLLPGGGMEELEVPPVASPVDDLGAGDVFAAAFFVMLAAGEPPAHAVPFATAAAAVRMQGTGAEAIGDNAAIAARLRSVGG